MLPRRGSVDAPLRVAVLISGGGSGLASIIKYEGKGNRAYKTVLVLSDSEEAPGLRHGLSNGIKTIGLTVPRLEGKKESRLAHERTVHSRLVENHVELVVLAGYMRILTPSFVGHWKGRLLNIHPSLLPKYPGAHAHRDALLDQAKVSGCTVHLVDEGVDSGPILAQSEVPVHRSDSVDDLQNRIKLVEHDLYPRIIDEYSTDPKSFIHRLAN